MSVPPKEKPAAGKIAGKNIVLLILVIGIAVIPFFIQRKAGFAGADTQAKEAIAEIHKDFRPWVNPIWTPPSGEVESLLFALQASIGSLVIGYYIGYVRGRKKREDSEHS